jgi:hypothetical protein
MDKDLQEYYEARFDMMATKGWKDLMEDVDKMSINYNNLFEVSTEAELNFKKGQIDILLWLLSLKETSEQAWMELQEDA